MEETAFRGWDSTETGEGAAGTITGTNTGDSTRTAVAMRSSIPNQAIVRWL